MDAYEFQFQHGDHLNTAALMKEASIVVDFYQDAVTNRNSATFKPLPGYVKRPSQSSKSSGKSSSGKALCRLKS